MNEDHNRQFIEALEEAIECLQEENKRLKNSNRICRIVIKSLREQQKVARFNDEQFKSLVNEALETEYIEEIAANIPRYEVDYLKPEVS